MRERNSNMRTLIGMFIVVAASTAGCGGSSSGTTANSPAPLPSSPSSSIPSPSASADPAPLSSGPHTVDISWGVGATPGVPCPQGLHGYCTKNQTGGSDAALGSLSLSEYIATPSATSCGKAEVEGTFSLVDQASSSLSYTGAGRFCWTSTSGTFRLTMTKGAGEFKGATGHLTAKIANGATKDEWTGTLHIKR